MSDVVAMLHQHLPRPRLDPRFRRELLDRLLAEAGISYEELEIHPGLRLRRYYLGGVVGAAIAVGAALGWRHRHRPRTQDRAA